MIGQEVTFSIEEVISLFRHSGSVAFFEAYFDESGTHDEAPYTFVGGFVAKQSSWLSMARQWKQVLSKFRVVSCHASDLNTLQGEFLGWDDNKRRSFVTSLFSVIKSESGLKSIGYGVERNLFDRIGAEYPKVELTPYTLCAEYCCAKTGAIAKKKTHWPPVAVVFEFRQPHDSATFRHTRDLLQSAKFRARYNINSITWIDKKGVIPLQFADMFVYELYKLHKARAKHGKSAQIRHPLQQFQKYVESHGALLTEEEVREYFRFTQSHQGGHGAKYL